MAKRVGVFCDVSNLYHCAKKRFRNKKLNYQKYLKFVEDLGTIDTAIAYGAQVKNEARNFIHSLQSFGYTTKYKKPKVFRNGKLTERKADWDIGIVVDIIKKLDDLDLIIIGSADGDFVPFVEYLLEQGKQVVIFACNISSDFASTKAVIIEIPETLME
jgi:uncharacterized LabA/DUF88 family protein